ncbi:MAG: hypothetical protein JNK82_16675 [Myxococcaceae bacterium]|nr:hypothetical protein [Myxococcaceae bacterium]
MRRIIFLAPLLLAALCEKPPPPKPPPPPPDPKAELTAKLDELYKALELQEPERLNEVLTADVLAYGLGNRDTFTNRDEIVESVRTELIPYGLRGDQFKRVTTSPHVQLAPGELSGWFYDFARFEQVRSGKASKFWKVRITGHAIFDAPLKLEGGIRSPKDNEEGPAPKNHWRVDALHVSFGYPDTELYAPDAAKKLKAPETAGADKPSGTEELVGLTRRMLDDIAVKVERTSESTQAVLIGTDPGDVFEGGGKFKELARPRLPELKKAAFTLKIEDGPRARMAQDGKSGWVSGVVVLRLGKPPKQQVLPAFRALWIFAVEKDLWSLVSEHQSLGLPVDLRKPAGDDEPTADGGS